MAELFSTVSSGTGLNVGVGGSTAQELSLLPKSQGGVGAAGDAQSLGGLAALVPKDFSGTLSYDSDGSGFSNINGKFSIPSIDQKNIQELFSTLRLVPGLSLSPGDKLVFQGGKVTGIEGKTLNATAVTVLNLMLDTLRSQATAQGPVTAASSTSDVVTASTTTNDAVSDATTSSTARTDANDSKSASTQSSSTQKSSNSFGGFFTAFVNLFKQALPQLVATIFPAAAPVINGIQNAINGKRDEPTTVQN